MTRSRVRGARAAPGGPGRPRNQRSGPSPRTKTILAVAVPVALAAGLVVALAPDSDDDAAPTASTTTTTLRGPSAEGRAWQTRIDDAFRPLADRLPEFVDGTVKWMAGEKPTDAFTGDVTRILPEFVRARDAVAAAPVFGEAPRARDLYASAAGLYLEVARVYLVAVEPPAEPLRGQLDLLSRRLRTLADRIYDRARALIDPSSQQNVDTEAVEMRRAPEVPDWGAEGLAPGPPLAEAPPPASETSPEREDVRPEEPVEEWLERVRGQGFASPRELARHIDEGDDSQLGGLAAEYVNAAMKLRDGPDPKGGRERGALVALSLLVHGEAARAGQAAARLPEGPARARLNKVARRLVLIGETTLERDLNARPSGLDNTLLTEHGP